MESIRASDCVVKAIEDKNIVKKFLDENHRQGYTNFIKAYGLFYNSELIQVMSFGKPRFNKYYSWELIRDCTKSGYVVRGGVSKLWKCFVKENNVRSCICYSYPHDKDNLYTNKYVDYCGFKNIKKSKPSKKIYFEGMWNDAVKRIDKSILERHGVDRLLKGSFGKDRTNEQILIDLGFEKKEEDGFEPQVDSYFPFGVLFRIDDLDDGSFYIGETTRKEIWEDGYLGSGSDNGKWDNHKKRYPPMECGIKNKNCHRYLRTILRDDFKTPKELYEAELEEILKYSEYDENKGRYVVVDPKCMNTKTTSQLSIPPCEECGAILGHKKSCSQYNEIVCDECGGNTDTIRIHALNLKVNVLNVDIAFNLIDMQTIVVDMKILTNIVGVIFVEL